MRREESVKKKGSVLKNVQAAEKFVKRRAKLWGKGYQERIGFKKKKLITNPRFPAEV